MIATDADVLPPGVQIRPARETQMHALSKMMLTLALGAALTACGGGETAPTEEGGGTTAPTESKPSETSAAPSPDIGEVIATVGDSGGSRVLLAL